MFNKGSLKCQIGRLFVRYHKKNYWKGPIMSVRLLMLRAPVPCLRLKIYFRIASFLDEMLNLFSPLIKSGIHKTLNRAMGKTNNQQIFVVESVYFKQTLSRRLIAKIILSRKFKKICFLWNTFFVFHWIVKFNILSG